MMYPLVRELAADGIPVTVTCRVLNLARQPYYRWLAAPVTAAELTAAYRANALFDAHRDDPEFGYRFLVDEARDAYGHVDDEDFDENVHGPMTRVWLRTPLWNREPKEWYEQILYAAKAYVGVSRLQDDPEFIAGIGLVWLLAPSIPWLGRLPGDIRIERENFRFYFPLATCLLLSLLVSLVIWAVRSLRG